MRCARDSAKQHDLARAVPYQGAELILVQERPRSAGAGGIGVGDDDRDGHVLTGHEPVCGDLDQSWLSRLLAALTRSEERRVGKEGGSRWGQCRGVQTCKWRILQ